MAGFNIDLPPVPILIGLEGEALGKEMEEYSNKLHTALEEMFARLHDRAGSDFGFVDRGDPAAWDFTAGTLTTDGTDQDMDLSSIVPKGAKAVSLRLYLKDSAVGSYIYFFTKGNSNAFNVAIIRIQVANVDYETDLLVACNKDRVVTYHGGASGDAFDIANVVVKGWWK